MVSLIDNLDLYHLSTGFAGAFSLLSHQFQPRRLAHDSSCQGGRRDDVLVHRAPKVFFVLCFAFCFVFVFLVIVKELVKCRSYPEPDNIMFISAMDSTEYYIVSI